MKNKFYLFPIVYIITLISPCFAQDIILLKDSSKMKTVIEEITPTEIRFRKYGETNMSTYAVQREDVLRISYQNGDVENFNNKKGIVIKKVKNEDEKESEGLEGNDELNLKLLLSGKSKKQAIKKRLHFFSESSRLV